MKLTSRTKDKANNKARVVLMFFAVVTILFLGFYSFKLSTMAATSNDWQWPTDKHSINSPFDWPNYPSGGNHHGTDFSFSNCYGKNVYSTCDGVVVGTYSPYPYNTYKSIETLGVWVVIQANVNNKTMYMLYGHLSEIKCSVGDRVRAGDVIGLIGNNGNSSGAHLHYEVSDKISSTGSGSAGTRQDPRKYLPGTSLSFETLEEIDTRYPTPFEVKYTGSRIGTSASVNGSADSAYWIENEEITVNEVYTDEWCKITYKSSSGDDRVRYTTLNALFGGETLVYGSYKAPMRTDVYYTPSTSNKRTYIGAGDTVWRIRKSGNYMLMVFSSGTASGRAAAWADSRAVQHDINEFEVTVNQTKMYYNGSALCPDVTVKNQMGTILTKGTDYTLSYSNNVDEGTATIKIIGAGTYDGWTYRYFDIVKGRLYLQYNMNGGSLLAEHGSTIGSDGAYITFDGKIIPWAFGEYGGMSGENGLPDYNNPNYVNIGRTGYKAKEGAQWNTKADGTGKSYDQYTDYPISEFADLSNGDVTLTLYVNWIPKILYSLSLNGSLDGNEKSDLGTFGKVDLKIDDVLASDMQDITDVYTQYPEGTSYEFTNIQAYDGYAFIGSIPKAVKGTIEADTTIILEFASKTDLGAEFDAYIKNPARDMYLTDDDENNVVISEKGDGKRQVWHFVRQEDGSYRITCKDNARYLDVEKGWTASETNVLTWSVYSTGDNQNWYICGSEDECWLRAECTQCILDIKGGSYVDGTNIQMYMGNLTSSQAFAIEKLPPLHEHTLDHITSKQATCHEEGCVEHWVCTGCGKYYSDENATEEISISQVVVPVDSDVHTDIVVINAKTPSCTETGYSGDTFCQGCEHLIEVGTILEATGHDWNEWEVVRPATETENGEEQRTCKNDSEHVETRVIEKTNTGGYFEGYTFSHSCSFGNDLSINYYAPSAELAGFTNIRLVLEKQIFNSSGSSFTWSRYELKTYTLNNDDGTEYYRFQFSGIDAKEMRNLVHAVLYADKDGITYQTPVDEYSVAIYAYNRLAKSKDNVFKTLLVDMLDYGSQAQVYFNYNTGNLANSSLTSEQRALGTAQAPEPVSCAATIDTAGKTAEFSGKSVVFNTNIELKYYMKFESGQSLENVSLRLSYTAVDGQQYNTTIPFSMFSYDSGQSEYSAKLTTIAAKDMGCPVTAGIYSGDTLISDIIVYSLETYCYNRLQKSTDIIYKALIRDMVKYGRSATAYFRH
ncbi:MAG: RICIN domain-containing protein [Lachnospiraceae bacterium]|nr:RICIN domain-containing protein [Lachnospiraceae bacterium]